MKCVHCGTQNTDDAKHCRRCGAILPRGAEVTAVLPLPSTADTGQTHPLDEDDSQTRPFEETPEQLETRPLNENGPRSGPLSAHRAPESDTRPLTRTRNFFEPLPKRAIINEGRCLIGAVQEASPLLNVYAAVSRRALVQCRQCGFTRNNFGDQ